MTDACPTLLSGEELQVLAASLAGAGVSAVGQLEADLISGGRSNLTFRLRSAERCWVLRMPPRTGRVDSAHDVAREFRITRALVDTEVPVAAPVLLGEHVALGGPFLVSEFVDGTALRTQHDLLAFTDAELRLLESRLLIALADLHRIDHRTLVLENFGNSGNYAERQLRRWARQWDLVGPPSCRALAESVMTALNRSAAPQSSTAVVHGDYRIDNTLVSQAGHVAAIVDWELSTLGDPVADVAMMCAYRDPAFDLIVGAPSAWTSTRLGSWTDLTTEYERAGGATLENWDWHLGLACFKIAAIAAGIEHRRRSGAGSGPGFDTAVDAVEPFLDLASRALRGVT